MERSATGSESAQPASQSTIPNVPSGDGQPFLTGQGTWIRMQNFWRMMTGNMSLVGQSQYWLDVDKRYEAQDCKRCEENRDYLLQYSPVIRFMSDRIGELGGELNTNNVRCMRCIQPGQGAGFDPDYGIRICANKMKNRKHTEDTLAHEMVHAYDRLRFKLDWEDLRHAACTEIRASSLSGECRWAREFFFRKQKAFTMHHQDCVRRRAALSVAMRPNCKDDAQAMKVVNEVWDSCFRDTRPFDEIYR